MKEADAKHDHAGGAARAKKTAQHYADSKKELLITPILQQLLFLLLVFITQDRFGQVTVLPQ